MLLPKTDAEGFILMEEKTNIRFEMCMRSNFLLKKIKLRVWTNFVCFERR